MRKVVQLSFRGVVMKLLWTELRLFLIFTFLSNLYWWKTSSVILESKQVDFHTLHLKLWNWYHAIVCNENSTEMSWYTSVKYSTIAYTMIVRIIVELMQTQKMGANVIHATVVSNPWQLNQTRILCQLSVNFNGYFTFSLLLISVHMQEHLT